MLKPGGPLVKDVVVMVVVCVGTDGHVLPGGLRVVVVVVVEIMGGPLQAVEETMIVVVTGFGQEEPVP
jgi:hypothetical protein